MRPVRLIARAVTILVAGLLLAAPAQADERLFVELSDTQGFEGVPGTFSSNIPGCATGRSYDVHAMTQLRPGVFRGTRMFRCASGIGSLTVDLSARFGDGGAVGTWSVEAGTGAFSGIRGAGGLTGTPLETSILDHYTGTVTVTG